MLVRLDRSSAKSVRKDHHHQLAHRRAHLVPKGHTPLKRGRSAHLVVPGHTRARVDQYCAQSVLRDLHLQLVHRRAQSKQDGLTPLQLGRYSQSNSYNISIVSSSQAPIMAAYAPTGITFLALPAQYSSRPLTFFDKLAPSFYVVA